MEGIERVEARRGLSRSRAIDKRECPQRLAQPRPRDDNPALKIPFLPSQEITRKGFFVVKKSPGLFR
jgi:hypothetical protein